MKKPISKRLTMPDEERMRLSPGTLWLVPEANDDTLKKRNK